MFLFDLNKFFDSFANYKIDIPKEAEKTEEVVEQDGYKTITTTYEAEGFKYVKRTTQPLPKEETELEKTKRLLKEAVTKEDYRKAAELKEEVKLLEEKKGEKQSPLFRIKHYYPNNFLILTISSSTISLNSSSHSVINCSK